MMEMLGGVIGGVGSIVSGILGAQAQDRATNFNYAIALLNYNQRERERREAMELADTLRREQKLGFTDIRGTRTKWVPGKGWVVTGAPELLEIMKLQDAEQKKQLQYDIPMRRKVMERNYARGIEDEGTADTFRRQLANVRMGSDDSYAADLYGAQALALAEGGRDMSRRVFTQAMRTGQNSNFAGIAAAMNEKNNEAYRMAALQSKIAAHGIAAKEYDERRKNIANLYNLFATRAGQLPEVNYKPMSIDGGSADLAAKNELQAGQNQLTATMMKGGTMDYMQPNYGWANAVGGGASALASAFRMGGASQRYRGGGSGDDGYGVSGFGGSIFDGTSDDMFVGNEA